MGLRADREQRHRAGAQAHLRQAAARVSQHADPRQRALRRPARRADGQQRSRPPEHRRRPHCADGHHAHRRADCIRRVRPRIRRSCRPCSARAKSGRQLHLFGLRLRRRRALAPGASLRAAAHGARIRRGSASSCTPSWTGATPRPTPARATLQQARAEDARVRRGQGRHDQRPLLRHGPRQALGARAQGLRRHGQRQGRGRRVRRSGGAHQGELQQRRHRRVHHSLCRGGWRGKPVGQIRDEDVCINFNFRADRARQITRVLARESGIEQGKAAATCEGWESLDADDSARARFRRTCTTSA